MSQRENPPDIVIRPAGVWDSRAPFFEFIKYHHTENQIYFGLILGINRLICELRQENSDQHARTLFSSMKAWPMVRRAWSSYKKSFPQDAQGPRSEPTVNHLCNSMLSSLPAVTEYAIMSYCGIFETFIECWALNYLLAKLEDEDKSSKGWTSQERHLARAFWPVAGTRLPSFHRVCGAIPTIKDSLTNVPHVFVRPDTDEQVDVPITPSLNAFTAVVFWREWRNLLVHGSGMVTQRFCREHGPFWRDFRKVFPYIRDIEAGKRLSLNDETFRAMTTTHYRAAKALRDILVAASGGRRGHILAPGPVFSPDGRVPPEELPERVPPLLLEGDHEPSCRWVSDADFRKRIRAALAP